MNFYENELLALKKSNRFRERKLINENLADLASNDYLGLAHNKVLLQKAYSRLEGFNAHSPKASMLVNGYHPLHKTFEKALCKANGFESGVIVGSGFSANIAMIEALVRKNDVIFIDALYHASGQLASQLVEGKVVVFKHNDSDDLETLMKKYSGKRQIIAVEGIYSMDGDRCAKEIITLANTHNALLIMDEAHSSGVIGKKLMGIFDFYDIEITPNIIKMGTLGKAYGSFGAYILASEHIISYLLNRAKPIIYATAPSLFDTALGLEALLFIQRNSETLTQEIGKRQAIVASILEIEVDGLIVPVVFGNNKKVLEIQNSLKQHQLLVGAIRQPTVEKAIVRIIARLGESCEDLTHACQSIASFR